MLRSSVHPVLAVLSLLTSGTSLAQTFPSTSPKPDGVPTPQGPVAADPPPAREAGAADAAIEDILVTARRTEERIQDVPLAITAVSGDNLQRRAIAELRDLSATVPNLNIQAGSTGAGSAVINIRGQSQTNVQPTIDSSVGLYIDNINVPRQYAIRDALVDIQRVEVLRGPQGTLYGRNTTGGAVSFFTKDPGDSLGATVQLSAGNYDSWGVLGIANAPLTPEVSLRLVASHAERDGFGKAVLRDDAELLKLDSTYLRAKIKGEFGRLTAVLGGDYSDLSTGGSITKIAALNPLVQTGTTPPGGGATREVALELGLAPSAALLTPAQLAQAAAVLQSYVGRPGFYDSYGTSPDLAVAKAYGLSLTLGYELSDALTLRSITGYRGVSSDWRSDNDGTPFVISENRQFNSSDFLSEEIQLLGDLGRLDFVAGLFYSHEDARTIEQSFTFQLLNNRNLVTTDGDISNESYAVFGQANYELLAGLTVTAGARYTTEKRGLANRNFNSAAGCIVDPRVRDNGVACKGTFDVSFSKPTWLLSLNYKIRPEILLYAKASRGFRGGGLNLRATGPNLALYQPFAPETVTEYEVGFKSELFDRRLRLNVAVFHDDYQSIQRNVQLLINNAATTLVTNAAAARLTGFEAEIDARPFDWISLNASAGHLNPRYREFVDLTGDRSGEPWPAPDWNYALGARVTRATGVGEASLTVNWNWQDDLVLTPNAPAAIRPFVTQKGYGLLNGTLGLTIDAWDAQVSLFGRNLTGERYYTSSIAFEAAGFSPLQAGEPRTFGIQFAKKFGSIE